MQRIERVFPWLLLAPAILPLVYVPGLLYPYVSPKTLLFRSLFILAAAAFAYLALSGRPFYWHRLSLKTTENRSLYFFFAWVPAALLVVAYGTSLVGIDFYHSFWSIFDRGDGLLTLTAAVGFFYLVLLHADKEFLMRLLKLTAWVGSILALYGFLQWLQVVTGMDFPLITEPRGRLGATFGNAAFLAAYLGLTFFVSLAVLREYKGKWLRVLQAGTALQLLVILLAATRGTILALVAAALLAALYFSLKGEGKVKTYARGGIVGVIALAALFFIFRAPLSDFPFEPVRRIASISLEDATVSSRFFVWENVLREALEKPLTGYGAEHIDVLFNRVYDPGAIIEEWFDRSHNAYLDYFVQFGILGVLLFIALIGAFALTAWRGFRAGSATHGLLFLAVVVYAAQNFFVFDTALTLWLLFALFSALLAHDSAGASTSLRALPHVVSIVAGIVILAALYPVALQPLRANLALAEGYFNHVVSVEKANKAMRDGLALNTYADLEYGYQAYTMYTDRQQTMLQGQDRIAAYEYALEILTKNYERYPYDARTATYLAHVLDSAPRDAAVDEAFLQSVLAKAMELSPMRAQGKYILANIFLKKGDASNGATRVRYYREAIAGLETYAAEVPALAEVRYIIANLYWVIGERGTAARWAGEGLALAHGPGAKGAATKAVKYYIATEDWDNALRFLKEIVSEDSDDYEQVYDLAKLYFLTGDKESALRIYERLKEVAFDVVASDPAFVRAIEG